MGVFKMSKGLEALEIIKNIDVEYKNYHKNAVAIFKENSDYDEVFDFIEKELKALDIIKKKQVNLRLIRFDISLEDFNFMEDYAELNQEEFDLLKEVLSNE